jgi:DNA repair exonuclease SbcCD ATPase subunit
MRILQLSIKGFGQLRGKYSLDAGQGKLGLLLEKNEAGKTTLMESILAALYGLDRDKRRARSKLSEWEVYRPWDGGPYGLILRLRHGSRELTIERDFRDDSARVLEAGRNVSDEFRSGKQLEVGERLLGISREHFLHSAFVRQGQVEWGDASGLSEAIQRMADSESLESTAAAALRALQKGLDEYEGATLAGKGKVDTEISRCEAEIQGIEQELAGFTEQRGAMSGRIEELKQSESRKRERATRREAIDWARARLRLRELEEELRKARAQREALAKLEAQVREESDLAELSSDGFQEAEVLCNRWEGARRTVESYAKDAQEAEAESAERLAARDKLGLKRAPRTEDIEIVAHAIARLKDIQGDEKRLHEAARREREAVRERGFDPDQAGAMLEALQYLTPEDRELLVTHTRRDFEIDELRESTRRDLSMWQRQLDEVFAARTRRSRLGGVTAAVGAALLATGLLLPAHWALHSQALPYGGGAVIVLGLFFLTTTSRLRRGEERVASERVDEQSRKLHEIEEKNQEHVLAWQDLAYRLGIPADELHGRYQSLRLVERNLDTLAGVDERLLESEKQTEDTLRGVHEAWEVFGGEPRVQELEENLPKLREAVKIYSVAAAAAENAKSWRDQVEEKTTALEQRESQAKEALARCGVQLAEGNDTRESLRKLREQAKAAEEARLRRDLKLPRLKEETPSEESLESLERRLQQAKAVSLARAREGLEKLPLPAEQSSPTLRESLEELERELAQKEQSEARAREDSFTAVRAFLNLHEQKVGPLYERLDEMRSALRRAREFKAAVTLAHDTLAKISRETYVTWAAQLNHEAGELLKQLGTGSRDIRFNENLEFEVMHEQKLLTSVEVDQQLSAGARDGVYLAARMAVSHLLSGSEGFLPLILDDPFAHADDERLIAGMKMLLHIAASNQQVLLLACQRSRYEWAAQELKAPPELVSLAFSSQPVPRADGGQ